MAKVHKGVISIPANNQKARNGKPKIMGWIRLTNGMAASIKIKGTIVRQTMIDFLANSKTPCFKIIILFEKFQLSNPINLFLRKQVIC